MFARLLRTLSRRSANQPRRPRMQRRLGVENLEGRALMATTGLQGLTAMSPVLHSGVLTVIGNDSDNTIEVSVSGSNIKVLGVSFPAANVKKIAIAGEGGRDTIKVSESIKVPTFLYGGSDADSIYGGGGVDKIYGGTGGDTIFGRAGDDQIFGGAGSDVIDGGAGSDSVLDASSSDRVTSASTSLGEDSTLTTYTGFKRDVVNEILRLVNVERTNRGLSRLTLSTALNSVASEHVTDMNRLQVPIGQGISHAFSGDTTPTLGSRLEANLISYSSAAENNAFRSSSASKTAKQVAHATMYGWDGNGGWMNSSGHKANILSSSVTKIGIGMAGSSLSSGYYFTQVFTG